MKRRKASSIFALLVIFLLAKSAGAYAAEESIPAPRGDIYVQDFADVLSPGEEQQLTGWGRQIEQNAGGAQVAVLAVDSIGESDIESYANEAFRTYQLGRAGEDNGVLLVLALKEKKVRIEVGYGLEGIIPDGKAGRILDAYAIPSLQAGKPNEAVITTYQALGNEVSGNTDAVPAPPQVSQGQDTGLPNWLVILIVAGLIILDMVFFRGTFTFLILSMIGRGGGGGGSVGGGGGSSGGGGASRGW